MLASSYTKKGRGVRPWMLGRILGRTVLALVTVLVLAAPLQVSAQSIERCFAETGFCISGRIRSYWEQNGGLPIFGYPISAQQEELIEGKAVQAQWFERTRLELHPENQAPYDVLLGRIGVEVLARQGRDWFAFPKSEPQQGCRFFAETGHNVCGAIWQRWQSQGLELDGRRGTSFAESLALFGLPLSGEMKETIEGKEYTVQWFERGRFELHPENQPPSDVLLGRLGAEARENPSRYILPGATVFPEGVAFQPSTGDFFVSSTSDGTIFKGNLRQGAAQPFLVGGGDGRTAATGLKVDDARGRLFVSGAATGQMFVYDVRSGGLLGKFATSFSPTFINDVAVVPNGDAFFTDSQNPFLYRVSTNASGQLAFEEWVNFNGTALQYQTGFNVNGITATADGAYLIVVQSNTGKLFRISTATKEIVEIAIGQQLTNGDGIELDGHTLYVVRNQQGLVVKVQLADDYASGSVLSSTTNASLAYPTTLAKAGDSLLVVNSQFNKRGPNLQPSLPFTVSRIPIP